MTCPMDEPVRKFTIDAQVDSHAGTSVRPPESLKTRIAIGGVAGLIGAAACSALGSLYVVIRGSRPLMRVGYSLPGLWLAYFVVVPTIFMIGYVVWPWVRRSKWGSIATGAALGAVCVSSMALPTEPLQAWLRTLPFYTSAGALLGGLVARPGE